MSTPPSRTPSEEPAATQLPDTIPGSEKVDIELETYIGLLEVRLRSIVVNQLSWAQIKVPVRLMIRHEAQRPINTNYAYRILREGWGKELNLILNDHPDHAITVVVRGRNSSTPPFTKHILSNSRKVTDNGATSVEVKPLEDYEFMIICGQHRVYVLLARLKKVREQEGRSTDMQRVLADSRAVWTCKVYDLC